MVFSFNSIFFSAFLTGGRWPYLWIATVLHGILIETICYILPDVDNFWHSTTPVMFLGGRLPLHIILLCKTFVIIIQHKYEKMQIMTMFLAEFDNKTYYILTL